MNKIDIKKILAIRLALARKQAGLSQGQVAKILNFHRPTISEIEAGRRNLTAEELKIFSNIYGVSVEWLISEKENPFDINEEKIELAARELAKLKQEDLDKVLNLLSSLRGK